MDNPAGRPTVASAKREQYQLPEIDAPSLEDLRVEVSAPAPPSAEELIERLHHRLSAQAPRRERKPGEAIAPGDEIECDIVTVVDGNIVPGGVKRSAHFEMREFLHLPGFVEQLLGSPTFSAQTFELTLPEDYPVPALAGRLATFYVEARRVFEVERPQLDDREQLQAAGLGDNLEEAMSTLAQEVDVEQGDQLLIEATQTVLDALASKVDTPIPEAAIDEELRQIWQKNEGLAVEGKAFSEEMIALAFNDFLQNPELRAQASQRIKVGLALSAIVREENLSPSAETMTVLIEAAAGEVGVSYDQAKKSLKEDPLSAQQAAQSALYQEAVNFVMSRAKIEVLEADLEVDTE